MTIISEKKIKKLKTLKKRVSSLLFSDKKSLYAIFYIGLSIFILFSLVSTVKAQTLIPKGNDGGIPGAGACPSARFGGGNNVEKMFASLARPNCEYTTPGEKFTATTNPKSESGGVNILNKKAGKTTALFLAEMHFKKGPSSGAQGVLDKNNNELYDTSDLGWNDDWNGILNDSEEGRCGGSDPCGGVYIQLFKEKSGIQPDFGFEERGNEYWQPLTSLEPVTTFKVFDKTLSREIQEKELYKARGEDVPKTEKENPLGLFENGQMINYWILRYNPTKLFFNKTDHTFPVALGNLDQNTTYYYRIVVREDESNQGGGRAHAYSEVTDKTKFTTSGDIEISDSELTQLNVTAEAGSGLGESGQQEAVNDLFGCSALKPSTWNGCFVQLYYNIIYTLSANILRWAAGLMDIFIAFSISDVLYRTNFVDIGWTVVRDVCNMFFIFILLWTALKIVINDHHFEANKVIVNIVIIGLLINFSLFFSRVIIDAGNITARVFYNQIRIEGSKSSNVKGSDLNRVSDVEPKSLSLAIAKGLGVQRFLANEEVINKSPTAGQLFAIIFLGTVVNIVAAWIFFKSGFNFLGRIISLWFGMIFSPAAFTTRILGHDTEGMAKFGWKDWIKNITDASFGAAIFLFFIFLIIQFINGDAFTDILGKNADLNTAEFIIVILIPFAFIIGLIKAAEGISKKMAGMFGGAIAGAVENVAKFTGGALVTAASGGTAKLLQKTVGASAAGTLSGARGNQLREIATRDLSQISDPEERRKAEREQDKAKRKLLALQNRAESSYDIRNTKAVGALSSATGFDFNAGARIPGLGGLSTERTAGGWETAKDRKAAKEKEREDKFKKILGDRKVNVNGKMVSIEEAQEEAEKMKSQLADLDETKKNDKDLISLEDELKRIEKAIKDNKDSGLPSDPKLVTQRDLIEKGIKIRNKQLETIAGFNPKDKQRELSELSKQIRDNKDGYVKEYMRNQIYRRQAELDSLNDHHGGSTASVFRREFFSRRNLGRLAAAMGAGAMVGTAVAGPLGTIAGTVAGALGGGRLSVIQGLLRSIDRGLDRQWVRGLGVTTDLSGARSFQAAAHDVQAGHVHQPHAHGHGGYHSPNSAWFDRMFGTGGGSSGSGGGHGSGGGGGAHH